VSIQSAPYYWVECDLCGANSMDGTEYTAWQFADQAQESAWDADWSIEGGNHVCLTCQEKWQRTGDEPDAELQP
jgi:hypothetical protein